jgi:hypothetical protein
MIPVIKTMCKIFWEVPQLVQVSVQNADSVQSDFDNVIAVFKEKKDCPRYNNINYSNKYTF